MFPRSLARDSHWASCYSIAGAPDPTDLKATSGNISIVERVNLVNSNFHGNRSREGNIYLMFRDNKTDFLRGKNAIFKTQHVIVQSNRGFLRFLLAHPVYGPIMADVGLNPCNTFGVKMNRYFHPTSQLLESVQRLLPWWSSNRNVKMSTLPVHEDDASLPLVIGIHVRTTDDSFKSLASGEEEPGFQGGLKKLNLMLESARKVIRRETNHSALVNKSTFILVLSNSQLLKAYVRAMNDTSLVVSDPKPKHINRNEFNKYHDHPFDEEFYERIIIETYTEWYAYSTVDIFIAGGFLKIGGRFADSGFSRTAMFRGLGDGRDFEAFDGAIFNAQTSEFMHHDSCLELMEYGARI
jgi:hypothetical protein